jgi:hypothetical protein
MIILCIALLLGIAWGLWNLYQKVQRLDMLIEAWEETLAILRLEENPPANLPDGPVGLPPSDNDLRVTIQITDAVGLAKRYHWAGGAGALAPNVLKKAMQGRILEETRKAMQEGGHEADLKVIVL